MWSAPRVFDVVAVVQGWSPRVPSADVTDRLKDVAPSSDSGTRGLAIRKTVDFQQARHQIEELRAYPAATRARALATYVGLFDLADEHGVLAVSSTEIANAFEITRVSWTQYREVLEAAGLLQVDRPHGGALRRMRLVAPV